MDISNVKVGEKYYGVIYTYSCRFLKGIRIKQLEIVKINPKTVGIAFDKDTRRYPQLMKKGEWPLINSSRKQLAEDFLKHLEDCKWPDYLKERIQRYCKRIIREADMHE